METYNSNNIEELVVWGAKYEIGVPIIDKQHQELVGIINELYRSCRTNGSEEVNAAFKDAMRRIVGYVRFHFSAEQELLERLQFPHFKNHIRQHEVFVRDIFDAARDFRDGKRFAPHVFVRTLRDWVLGHIAVSDKQFAQYFTEQKKMGSNIDFLK
ncbi:MAG: bacteriohemerythrin [Treponema sp.]|nr:bacteriohemerythrin [Treponema sp.]